jgi:hypothetical protein
VDDKEESASVEDAPIPAARSHVIRNSMAMQRFVEAHLLEQPLQSTTFQSFFQIINVHTFGFQLVQELVCQIKFRLIFSSRHQKRGDEGESGTQKRAPSPLPDTVGEH